MLWEKCLETLRAEIPDSLFSMWILPLTVKLEDANGGKLEILAPNAHYCKHIENEYLARIQQLATKYHGADMSVSIKVDNQVKLPKQTKKNTPKKLKLNPLFTYEDLWWVNQTKKLTSIQKMSCVIWVQVIIILCFYLVQQAWEKLTLCKHWGMRYKKKVKKYAI